MARSIALRHIGALDLPGGGQVTVKDGLCFVGHIESPNGTTIIDVSDPLRPRIVARITIPLETHSHKVRVANGLMFVNCEVPSAKNRDSGLHGGLRIFDLKRPEEPREICFFKTFRRGVHRFDIDGRYAYLSTEMEGYRGNIVVVVDLADPVHPREVSRWWVPGQWQDGGEPPLPQDRKHQVHHPLRFGDRLFVSCCHAGMAVVDVSDIASPKTVLHHPVHGLFTHTLLPVDPTGTTVDFAIVVDEGWWGLDGWLSVADLADPGRPQIVAEYTIPPGEGRGVWASHQPHEAVIDGMLFVAWFSHGLRVIDVSDPRSPAEIGAFQPQSRQDSPLLSNDVFVDTAAGMVYLIDRTRGLDILEMAG